MKNKTVKRLIFFIIVVFACWLIFRPPVLPVTTFVSTDTICYEITKDYVPDTKEKQIIVKYSENGYETIISIGIGQRTTSVMNFETKAFDMYVSANNPRFDFDKFPSDEDIVSQYLDYEKDRFLGHYGEPFEPDATPEPSTVPETVPDDYPPVDIIADNNALLSANILTKRITPCIKLSSTPEIPEFNDMMIMAQMSGQEDENFCYYNIFPSVYYGNQFKASNMEKVMRQLMGDYDWDAETDFGNPPNGGWNKHTLSYEFSTDFGWGMQFYHTGDYVYSEFENGNTQVISHFELFGPDKDSGDPDHKSYGNYRLIYDIVSEDGETFLRFNRYEKE